MQGELLMLQECHASLGREKTVPGAPGTALLVFLTLLPPCVWLSRLYQGHALLRSPEAQIDVISEGKMVGFSFCVRCCWAMVLVSHGATCFPQGGVRQEEGNQPGLGLAFISVSK